MPKTSLPNWSLPRNTTQKWDWAKILCSSLFGDDSHDGGNKYNTTKQIMMSTNQHSDLIGLYWIGLAQWTTSFGINETNEINDSIEASKQYIGDFVSSVLARVFLLFYFPLLVSYYVLDRIPTTFATAQHNWKRS